MAKVNYDYDFELCAYSPSGEFLGIIRTQGNLLDFLVQIMEEKADGYYIVNVENGVRCDINAQGRIPNSSFRDRTSDLLRKLFGLALEAVEGTCKTE